MMELFTMCHVDCIMQKVGHVSPACLPARALFTSKRVSGESTSCVSVNTDLLVFCRSRDQPSLGPAVALTPPRLNSLSDRLSSKLNVVD